jgi:hypothetical protein
VPQIDSLPCSVLIDISIMLLQQNPSKIKKGGQRLRKPLTHENCFYVFREGLLGCTTQFRSMLDWYIGESMASIYNINNGIKNLLDQYQNCDTAQI